MKWCFDEKVFSLILAVISGLLPKLIKDELSKFSFDVHTSK